MKTITLIPNYNGQVYLPECLTALSRQNPNTSKIVLIDDGSADGSVDYVRNFFPDVDIFKLEKNLGFARAVNAGIKYARAKYQPTFLAVLNNDTKVSDNWLAVLEAHLSQNSKIAAVTSNMLFHDQPNVINSQGGTCNTIGYAHDINSGKGVANGWYEPRPVLGACWGAALIRASSLDDVGLLDERFFSFVEDLDWGWRANLLGYQIMFEPLAVVLHHGSASWQGRDVERHYLCFRNMLCTMLKNYNRKNFLLIGLIIVFHYPMVSLGYILNLKFEAGRLVRIFKNKNNLLDRWQSSLIPWKSLYWNIKERRATRNLRQMIQKKRKVTDEAIFKLMNL